MELLRKNWFMAALAAVSILAVLDNTGITVNPGLWLKSNNGPDYAITMIFFLSGLALDMEQVRAGFYDVTGTLTALAIIFIAAPLTALLFSLLPLPTGILLGLLLVGVMPSTLSSGVVMTGAAGGNMAHALLITIIANCLAVFTIPLTLALLLIPIGDTRTIEIDQLPIMIKIGSLVLLPLAAGMFMKSRRRSLVAPILPHISTISQAGILLVVWMAACQGREAIIGSFGSIPVIIAVTVLYHLLLIMVGLAAAKTVNIGKGCRESVILMGGQKTLPLSLILQVSLFPEFGLALVVCVLHHITHLVIDSLLVRRLRDMP